jgi:hypothetical protein
MELLTDGRTVYEVSHYGCSYGHCQNERPVWVYELTSTFDRRYQLTMCRDANKLYPYTKEDPD